MTRFLNGCQECHLDFASVKAFDRHRVGVHDYTFWEGVEKGVEDGRRCRSPEEMVAAGMEIDPKGRWRIALTAEKQASLRAAFRMPREGVPAAQDATGTPVRGSHRGSG